MSELEKINQGINILIIEKVKTRKNMRLQLRHIILNRNKLKPEKNIS